MKKVLSIIFSLLIVISSFSCLTAFAAVEDNYSVSNKSDGTVTISMYTGSDTTVLIPTSIGGKTVTAIGMMAFYFSDIINATVPSTVKTIESDAFNSSTNLRFLTLNEGLERIENNAFDFCSMLESVNIPSTVNYIGEGVFGNDELLKSITVSQGNEYYYSDGAVLYDINRTALKKYPASKTDSEYTVPYTVTKLDSYSFALTKNLKTLNLPVSVTEIGDSAFSGSGTITDIYYGGTEEQWSSVVKGSNNNVLNTATIHYSSYPECSEHSWNDGVQTSAPSCTEKGTTTYTCIICGSTKEEDITALGHNWGEWSVTTKPSCTEKGVETRKCSRCNEEDTRDVDAKGHTPVTDEAVPATCTESGLTEGSHCSVCNTVLTAQETTDPLGHNWGEWSVTTKPTCVDSGEETRACSRCLAEDNRPVDPTGVHTWNDGEETKAATCTEDGETTYTCTVCGETKTEPITSEGAHKWNDGEITTEPTCTEKGVKTFTCTVCGATKTEAVDATGVHTEVVDKAVPATFSKTGLTKGSHCSVCGTVLTEQKNVAKLGAPKIVKLKMNKKGLTIKWKTVKKVHGYKIQISTSKKFKKGKTKTFTVRDQKQAKRTIRRYRKGKYYVRIRAYKVISGEKQYSKWSKAKSVEKR